MDQSDIFQKIKAAILAEVMTLPQDLKITQDTMWDSIDLDSIDKLNIIMMMEHAFMINIPDIDFQKFFEKTIKDSVEIIDDMIKQFE